MRYQPLKGKVLTAELLSGKPSFVKARRRRKGALGIGIRYERKVQRQLLQQFSGYMAGPWFRYSTTANPGVKNYAQPDGLLIDIESGQITIIEIKYNHCAEAYFQLVEKYLPIARVFFNNSDIWTFATCEICYWYDGAVAFPTEIKKRQQVSYVRPNELAVHICRP